MNTTINTVTTIPSFTIHSRLLRGTDRLAAMRLALGAALADPQTAKLSNAAIAQRVGCSPATVRRYRKIADVAGITGSIRVGTPSSIRPLPASLLVDLSGKLLSVIAKTEGASSELGKQLNFRAKALEAILARASSESDLTSIRVEAEKLTKVADILCEEGLL